MLMRLYNEDSIDLLDTISDCSIDLIVTDPPYKTITGGNKDGFVSRPRGILSGNRTLFKYQYLNIKDWMPKLYRVLKQGSHCYIFTNSLNMKEMLIESEKAGFKLHNILVWEKNNCTPSQYYMKNCEYVLFLRKGKAKWIYHIGDSKTVHQFNNITCKKLHPTQKPVDLLQFYIENSSKIGDTVLDPFMGSCSTGVACVNTKRNFIGIERERKYFDISVERIKNTCKVTESMTIDSKVCEFLI